MERSLQKVYVGVLLGSSLEGRKGSRTGKRGS